MATEGTFVLTDIGCYTPMMKRMSTKMLRETFLGLKEFCESGEPAARAQLADAARE
jgi:hypothetical protein